MRSCNLKLALTAWCLAVLSLRVFAAGVSGWEVVTVAGTGEKGYDGDGGPATRARINNPYGVIGTSDGEIYFCDMDNHVLRKVDRKGVVTTVAGTSRRGFSGNGGPAVKAEMNEPYEIRFDPRGNLVVVEMRGAVIRRIDRTTGVISVVAGTGREGFLGDGGPALDAEFRQPHSIQFDQAGQLYICDIGNHRLRRVGADGVIQTISGDGTRAPTTEGIPLREASLHGPRAVDFDRRGRLWIALREGNVVYRSEGSAPTWTWKRVAGTGAKGFTGNGGDALQATLSGPKGLSMSPNGDVYLADTESHTIRVVRTGSGMIECLVGDGVRGAGKDGEPLQCRLNRPHGVYAEIDGMVIIGDSENHRVRVLRRIAPDRSR